MCIVFTFDKRASDSMRQAAGRDEAQSAIMRSFDPATTVCGLLPAVC